MQTNCWRSGRGGTAADRPDAEQGDDARGGGQKREIPLLNSLRYPMEVLRQLHIRCRFTIKRRVYGKKLIQQ